MYEHVKTGCKHIPPSAQPLQFQSGYFLNKPRIIIIHVTLTYSSLLNLMGMLERAILRSFCATLISNGAFKSGSSKHGKTRRALPEDSLVAANHLPSNKTQNVYCARLQLLTAVLWRIQVF